MSFVALSGLNCDGLTNRSPTVTDLGTVQPTRGSPRLLLATAGDPNGVDWLVGLAHTQPRRAESMLARCPELARACSSWGETCLQAASHLGHLRLAMRLLDIGVPSDLFVECMLGEPARAVAAVRSCAEEPLGVHGLPVLHFAVMSRRLEAVDCLLAAGARLNPPNFSLSPLHAAVALGDVAIVERLVLGGANPSAPNAFGETPIDWAYRLEGDGSRVLEVLVRTDRQS